MKVVRAAERRADAKTLLLQGPLILFTFCSGPSPDMCLQGQSNIFDFVSSGKRLGFGLFVLHHHEHVVAKCTFSFTKWTWMLALPACKIRLGIG